MADLTRDHPYRHLPDRAFWRRAVAGRGPAIVPLGGRVPPIGRGDRVATAGSCFAQHIGRHLAANGYDYLVTETAHPIVPAEIAARRGYGLFTARYGNIYTALQLLQLADRAYGGFAPQEDAWSNADGGIVDPFRPSIEPGGFASVAEMRTDRRQHLEHVREAFETLDVFVFTLGLTETWVSRLDGAAYPLCPGIVAGSFDPARHRFHNLRVAEVTAQLAGFVQRLRRVNPKARIVLTVSPVPLAATAVPDGHVLAATIYSKSVLRAAAQEIAEDRADIFYFPSYEIITGPQARGRYFADDLRTVTEEGVAHVMAAFLSHAGEPAPPAAAAAAAAAVGETAEPFVAAMQQWVEVMCDEAALDPHES